LTPGFVRFELQNLCRDSDGGFSQMERRGVIYLIRQSAAHIFYRVFSNLPTAATASGEIRPVEKL